MLTRATPLVDELYKVPEKAEIVDGKIIRLMATGRMPSHAAFELAVSLRYHAKQTKLPGTVVADNAGFLVNLPNRSSFSPDAAYYVGPNSGMRFFEGAPVLPPKCAVKTTTGWQQKQRWRRGGAIISRQGASLSGM